jgi:hypothetical protein
MVMNINDGVLIFFNKNLIRIPKFMYSSIEII